MTRTLPYEAPVPRRRPFLRRLLWLAAIAFLGLSALLTLPMLINSLTQRYWISRCMNHSLPPETVVLDCSLSNRSFYIAPETAPLHIPDGSATIFLHAMHLPGEDPRIIRVMAVVQNSQGAPIDLLPEVIGSAWPIQRLDAGSVTTLAYTQRCRIFAAQPDPANAAHFTFICEIDGTKHTFDGWLQPHDQVLIADRTPAVTP
jgi:hypothetical protein